MAVFTNKKGILIYHYDAETVRIEPWGENAFRIRATKNAAFTDDDWALSMKTENIDAQIHIDEKTAFIKNGKIRGQERESEYSLRSSNSSTCLGYIRQV